MTWNKQYYVNYSYIFGSIDCISNILGIAYRQDFDGFCRKGDGSKDYIKDLQAKNVGSCYQTCKDTSGCVAFAFTPESTDNCDLYRGGPYTRGSGRAGSQCFPLEPGISYALLKPT